jgi:hypothetical protein
MSIFRPIPDEIYKEAGDVIRHASGQNKDEPLSSIPYASLIVAGAVVAMEKAGIKGPYFERTEVTANDWVKEGSLPWRSLHGAVAQILDPEYRKQADIPTDNRSLIRHIVSDTLSRTENSKLKVQYTMPLDSDKETEELKLYRGSEAYRKQSELKIIGRYSELSEAEQKNMSEKFLFDPMDKKLDQEIEKASMLVSDYTHQRGVYLRQADHKLADFKDYGGDLIARPSSKIIEEVDDLIAGKIEPKTPAQSMVIAYAEHFLKDKGAGLDSSVQIAKKAMVQYLAQHRDEEKFYAINPVQGASKIDNYVKGFEQARKDFYEMKDNPVSELNMSPDPEEKYTRQQQRALFETMEKGQFAAPVDIVKIAMRAEEIQEGNLLSVEKDRAFIYENVKPQDIQNPYIDDLYRPGDKVRLALNNLGEDLKGHFMDDVLTIDKTIIKGDKESDGIGGERDVIIPQYEFKGVTGRYSAAAFQHERGDEHATAIVLEKNDRLWMIPFTDYNFDDENRIKLHEPREIQKADFPKSMEGFGFAELKEDAKTPMMGEFTYRPLNGYGDDKGPVELAYIPWRASVSEADQAKAHAIIDNRLAEEQHGLATRNVFTQMAAEMGR